MLALHYVDDLEAAEGFDEGADLRVGGQRSTDNGDYVAFREHLTDSSVPGSGVLVEMQVYRRGQGRTFAQPRASIYSATLAAVDDDTTVEQPGRRRQGHGRQGGCAGGRTHAQLVRRGWASDIRSERPLR